MKLLFTLVLLFVSSTCYCVTIKATGVARAVIINSETIKVENQPVTIVYTEIGPTAQVVF